MLTVARRWHAHACRGTGCAQGIPSGSCPKGQYRPQRPWRRRGRAAVPVVEPGLLDRLTVLPHRPPSTPTTAARSRPRRSRAMHRTLTRLVCRSLFVHGLTLCVCCARWPLFWAAGSVRLEAPTWHEASCIRVLVMENQPWGCSKMGPKPQRTLCFRRGCARGQRCSQRADTDEPSAPRARGTLPVPTPRAMGYSPGANAIRRCLAARFSFILFLFLQCHSLHSRAGQRGSVVGCLVLEVQRPLYSRVICMEG